MWDQAGEVEIPHLAFLWEANDSPPHTKAQYIW